jgi:hypothetical protein
MVLLMGVGARNSAVYVDQASRDATLNDQALLKELLTRRCHRFRCLHRKCVDAGHVATTEFPAPTGLTPGCFRLSSPSGGHEPERQCHQEEGPENVSRRSRNDAPPERRSPARSDSFETS